MDIPAIRVALICASRTQAEITKRNLSVFGEFNFVHTGKDFKTNFKKMVEKDPQVIIVDTASNNDYYREFDPRFLKIGRFLPRTRILIRTELPEQHPFVQEAYENGASIVDERLAYQKIAETICTLIDTKEQVVRYESQARHDIEHSANPSRYGKPPKPEFRDHKNLRPIREKERS